MKQMKRKDQFITVVGTWDGTEGEITQWLTANGYVWIIQTESPEQIGWRTKPRALGTDDNTEAIKQLSIIGPELHESCDLSKGSTLLVMAGRLSSMDADWLESEYEDI